MDSDLRERMRGGYVVLPCEELEATLDFFTATLGFEVESIFPADAPEVARLCAWGTRLELRCGAKGDPGRLRLSVIGSAPPSCVAPNGTRIEFAQCDEPLDIPELEARRVLTRHEEQASWVRGRAGMLYRDLLPDRLGGRFIASHIRIPEGGPVPDYAHFHRVRFQMIFCHRGWVRVVYEDQGEPFVLEAGDCVLQPPTIRHRVLECSAGLEVVEIGCPAVHETRRDFDIELPTGRVDPARLFEGQRFVRHVARGASFEACPRPGFDGRSIGFERATSSLAEARVLRAKAEVGAVRHDAELCLIFVRSGRVSFAYEGEPDVELVEGDALSIPSGDAHVFANASENFEMLELCLPARPSFS